MRCLMRPVCPPPPPKDSFRPKSPETPHRALASGPLGTSGPPPAEMIGGPKPPEFPPRHVAKAS